MPDENKIIKVGCAVVHRNGKILIAQRNENDFLGGYWEFPGGKIEPGENMEQCLVREVFEELGIQIKPSLFIKRADYTYPEKKVALFFYLCDWVSGEPKKIDCQDFAWVTPEEMRNYKFPDGDDDMINELIKNKNYYFKK